MKKHTMLIAGATGLVGAAAVEHFAALEDWDVIAVSRRAMALPPGVRHMSVDLTDRQACESAAANLKHVTHILFAALFELPELVAGWRDPRQMAVNEAMLKNLMDTVGVQAKGLRHVTIMQGTKAYGGHVEPAPVPCKERWPRHQHENFYWLQEDLLRQRQPHSAWTFSVLRPQIVLGYSAHSPMNIIAAIGAYAAVQRELGQPLCFPGGGKYINGGSDSRMIAQAAEFVATHEIAANETYNVVNGDALVWQDFWPSIARQFKMEPGPDKPLSLTQSMPDQEATWQRVVKKHGLAATTLDSLVGSSWQFTDRAFAHGVANPSDSVLSTIKLRQHGMPACYDTEDAVLYWLERMQSQNLLPR